MNWSISILKPIWLLKRVLLFSCALSPLFSQPLSILAQDLPAGSQTDPCRSLLQLAELLNGVQEGSLSVSSSGTEMVLQKDINLKDAFAKSPGIFFTGEKDQSYTFDLNGHKITTNAQRFLALKAEQNFTFTIEDSKGNGVIESQAIVGEEGAYSLVQTGAVGDENTATLILKSGTLISNENAALSHSHGLLILDGATLISKTDVVNAAAVNVQQQGAMIMQSGTIENENGVGIGTTGDNDLTIEGGLIQGVIGINTTNSRAASPTLHMSGGVIEGSMGGINARQLTAEISGEAKISGIIGILCSGASQDQKGVVLNISGGSIEAEQEAITYALFNNTYDPQSDGYAAISGGTFYNSDPAYPTISGQFATESSASLAGLFQVSGGAFFSKVDPQFIKEPDTSQAQEVIQVLDNADPDTPWHYTTNLNQALEITSKAPFNTYTYQEDLNTPEVSLTLNANVPAGAGTVSGLYGENQYIVSNLNQYSVIHLPALQLSGYSFEGWSTALSGEEASQKLSSLYSIPAGQSAITLYGSWSPDPDTPASIPISGKGIDEIGSQTTVNTSGNSTTTYYMGELGNRAKSVTNNSAPSIATKTDLSILTINEDNNLQNPLPVSLGENTANGNAEITIPGNQPLQNAPTVSAFLPFSEELDYISLPLTPGTGSYSSVAMSEIDGTWSVSPLCLIKDGRLIVELSNGQALGFSTLSIVNNAKVFKDVTSSMPQYGKNAIAFMSSRELMSGVADKQYFDPAGILTRAQFATILYRFVQASLMEPDQAEFNYPADVPAGLWYSRAAAWACSEGFMAQGSNFDASRPISREELCTILYRLQEKMNNQSNQINQNNQTTNTALLGGYSDGSQASDWAKEGVAWAIENRIIGQDSRLDPLSSSIRVNSAAMFERYLENACRGWKA